MVREDSVESFYTRIRGSVSASSLSPLLDFPSTCDVDSLCALKMILHVLESDSIRYACYPVSSFQEIHKYLGPEICGSGSSAMSAGSAEDAAIGSRCACLCVDSHRPIHFHNLSSRNDNVVVLYTNDDEKQADLFYHFQVSPLADECDLDGDDGENERVESEDEEESESEEDGDGDAEGDANGGRKKMRKLNDVDGVQLFRKLKKEYYKSGTFHGKPSGSLMYELSHFLRKNTKELLWLGCVALTDQFVHERLTDERYQVGVMELEQH